MAHQLRHEMVYDHSVAEVTKMLADPVFREEVCTAQGVLDRTIQIEKSSGHMDVRIEQVQPSAGVPGFAKTFVGDTTEVIQQEVWSSPTHADVEVIFPGKPSSCRGTIVITPTDGGGCLETVTVDIKVGLPLVGGKLEFLLKELMRKGLETENQTGRKWLEA